MSADNLPATIPDNPRSIAVSVDGRGVVIRSLDELARFAKAVYESGIAPKGFDSPQAVMVAAQTGMEAGLTPMASIRSLVVIPGTREATWRGQAALGLIRNSRVCRMLLIGDAVGDGEARSVSVTCQRTDMENPAVVSFSMKDARIAGLSGKDNWKHYGDDMLLWRAIGRVGKRYFSDVLMGLGIEEDVRDYPSTPQERPSPTGPDPILVAQAPKPEPGVVAEAEIVPERVKCDGNHGGPVCADPQCWATPDPEEEAEGEKARRQLQEQAAAIEATIRMTNTQAGIGKVWAGCADLREILDPDALDALTRAKETRLSELKGS